MVAGVELHSVRGKRLRGGLALGMLREPRMSNAVGASALTCPAAVLVAVKRKLELRHASPRTAEAHMRFSRTYQPTKRCRETAQ